MDKGIVLNIVSAFKPVNDNINITKISWYLLLKMVFYHAILPSYNVPLLPDENSAMYRGLKYPGVHSFRAGRLAAKMA